MSTVHTLSLSELRTGLDEKRFSALELTKQTIAKAKKLEHLNSFITLCEDSALREAELADKRLAEGRDVAPFTGIPVGIKDLISTDGIRTTGASKILANYVPPYDATVTARLKNQGAVIVGKMNCDEFGMGSSNENSAYGNVKNPWDPEYVPGGSSGGSAAAVAAQIVPMALGTDTGGSIRQPASLCNLVGLKPTYGRVSRFGLFAYASSLDTIGPLTRTVRDAAISLQAIAGKDPRDATTMDVPVVDYQSVLGKSISGMRIGIPKEYFVGGLQAEVETSVRAAIKELERLGARVVEISLPHVKYSLSTYYIVVPAEASSNLARYDGVKFGHRAGVKDNEEALDLFTMYCRTRTEGFGPEVKRRILIGTHVLSTGYYDAYYLKGQKVRSLIARDFAQAFASNCDVVLCPTSPTTAFKFGAKMDNPLEMYLSDVFTVPVNLAGLPALSVPCGFDKSGLPIGLQLIGQPWREDLLLQAAFAYERETEWHKMTPTLAE